MTTYTKRTNAKRAAIKNGIPESEVEITTHKSVGETPRFGFKRKETQAVTPAKAAGKARSATAARVAAAPREQRNGVKRPVAGGLCRAVWDWLDQHPNAKLGEVREVAIRKGWNQNNASIELYQWRRFNGLMERSQPSS